MNQSYLLSYSQILTLFMVMLGPFRLLVPFMTRTSQMSFASVKKLATSSALLAVITLIAGGLIGKLIMAKWQIETPIMLLAGAIVFFLSAIRLLAFPTSEIVQPKTAEPTVPEIALNFIITPYGMASVIVLISVSHDSGRTISVFSLLAVIMLLNCIFMLFGKQILKFIGALPLQVMNKVLSVLQLALSIELIYKAFQLLNQKVP